jgi:hypothetical protein
MHWERQTETERKRKYIKDTKMKEKEVVKIKKEEIKIMEEEK